MKWTMYVGVFALAATRAIAAQSLDDVVASKYPATLTDFVTRHHLDEKRQQAYVLARVGAKDYIVAAYSNGSIGAIELLDRSVSGTTVLQAIRDHQQGYDPKISAIDLDGDGLPEIVVRFALRPRGGTESWIYRISNEQLTLISPTEKHGDSNLGYADILDFSGNGLMDLVDKSVTERGDNGVVTWEHYTLRNGSYVAAAALDFYEVFFREKGNPITERVTFSLPAAAIGKPYRLTIINGGTNGPDYRVSGGTVTLNGVTVSSPSDFGQTRGSWTVPITLQADNVLTVRLDGKPRGRIAVAVRHD